MKTILRATAVLSVLVLSMPQPAAGQGDPAALVFQVQGQVDVRQGGETSPAAIGQRLVAGDDVIPGSGSRAVLITRVGQTLNVTSETTIREPSGAGNPDLFDRAVRTLARAATADARATVGRQGMIRPVPGGIDLVAPRNGLTVTSSRPTFSWTPMEGATAYTLQLRRVDGGTPVRYQVGGVTEWTLPPEEPALIPGARYAWTVAPARGRPAPEQQFELIGAEDFETLEYTLDQIEALGVDPEGDGLFLAAVVYRDLELFYDAWAALSGLDGDGALAGELHLLRGEILNRMGRVDEARAAFEQADRTMR